MYFSVALKVYLVDRCFLRLHIPWIFIVLNADVTCISQCILSEIGVSISSCYFYGVIISDSEFDPSAY